MLGRQQLHSILQPLRHALQRGQRARQQVHRHLHQDEQQRELLFRSEEHTSELQSLMRISYAVFCLKKKKNHNSEITRKITIKSTSDNTLFKNLKQTYNI